MTASMLSGIGPFRGFTQNAYAAAGDYWNNWPELTSSITTLTGSYKVTTTKHISGSLTVSGTVYIYIQSGCTLTVAASANGKAAILLESGNTLIVRGGGTLNANGGKGGSGGGSGINKKNGGSGGGGGSYGGYGAVYKTSGATVNNYAGTPLNVSVYNITYNLNYSGATSFTEECVTLPSVTNKITSTVPTRTGYNFGGWTTNSDGTGANYSSGANAPSSATTLYAKWTAKKYTATLNIQGATYNASTMSATTPSKTATGGAASTTFTYDAQIPASVTPPTRTGYTFQGYWDTNAVSGGNQYYNGSGTRTRAANWTTDSTITLHARWTANTYNMTFDRQESVGTTAVTEGTAPETLTFDTAMPNLTPPSRIGYDFSGYYTVASGGGTKIYNADGTPFTTNWEQTVTTLYAYWTPKTYNVTLEKQGGTGGNDSVTATFDKDMPDITIPARQYYYFDGYYTETNDDHKITDNVAANGTKYYNSDIVNGYNGTSATSSARTWIIPNDANLYAKWITPYDIVYDAMGGNFNGISPSGWLPTNLKVHNYRFNITDIIPTWPGYVFRGWATDPAATVGDTYYNPAANYDTNADLKLYAVWTPIPAITISKSVMNEGAANNGGVTETQLVMLTDGSFTENPQNYVTVNNLPQGLTASVVKTNDTTLTISFTGKALNHKAVNTANNLSVTIKSGGIKYPSYGTGNGTAPTSNTAALMATSNFSLVFRDADPPPVPSLTTPVIDQITMNTARFGSSVTLSSGTVKERGFVYADSNVVSGAEPRIGAANVTKAASGSGTGAFNSNITGLEAGKKYIVAAYAVTDNGTYYGNAATFTAAALPTLGGTTAMNVKETTAIISGSVLTDGGSTLSEVGVVYSTVANPSLINGASKTVSSSKAVGAFSVDLTGLTPNTLYYVRTYATNDSGTAYGTQITMRTPAATADPSYNTYLASLLVDAGSVVPAFNKNVQTYTISVPVSRQEVKLTPTAEHNDATVRVYVGAGTGLLLNSGITDTGAPDVDGVQTTVSGMNLGADNIVYIEVTHGGQTRTYAVNIVLQSANDADLLDMKLYEDTSKADKISYLPVFSADTSGFAATVPWKTKSVYIELTVNEGVTATINGNPAAVASSGRMVMMVSLSFSPGGTVGLNGASTTVTIRTTSQDGKTTKTYTVLITKFASSNANLSNLLAGSTNGGNEYALAPAFDPTQTVYGVNVPDTASDMWLTPTAEPGSKITVNWTDSSGATKILNNEDSYNITGLKTGANLVYITVMSPDGTNTVTYTVTVTRAASEAAGLSGLTVTNDADDVTYELNPAFDNGKTAYTVTVENGVATATVRPVVAAGTSYYFSQSAVYKPANVFSKDKPYAMALLPGANVIYIHAVSDGGGVKTTALTIIRGVSSNANLVSLTGLTVNSGEPVVPDAVADPGSAPTAPVVVDQPDEVLNEDDPSSVSEWAAYAKYQEDYAQYEQELQEFNEAKTAYDAYQQALTNHNDYIDNLPYYLTPSFNKDTGVYSIFVKAATDKVDLTATPEVLSSTIALTVNGAAQTPTGSGVRTDSVSLKMGQNTLVYTVTAQDGTTIKQYTITITRSASNNARLNGLTVVPDGEQDSIIGFDPNTSTYYETVPNNTDEVTVTATPSSISATVYINGTKGKSQDISLAPGSNEITVKIVAEDGTTINEYTVVVYRSESDACDLTALTVDGKITTAFDPSFSSSTLAYSVSVEPRCDKATITATADKGARVNILKGGVTVEIAMPGGGATVATAAVELETGANVYTIEVIAPSGAKKVYTLTITREAKWNFSPTAPNEIAFYELLKAVKPGSFDLGTIALNPDKTVTNGMDDLAFSFASVDFNNDGGVLTAIPTLSDTTLSFTGAAGVEKDKTSTLTVHITAANYNDVDVVVTFKSIPKKLATITGVTDNQTKVYDGNPFALDISGISITDGDDDDKTGELTGKLKYRYKSTDGGYDSETPPTDAGEYTVTIIIDDEVYEGESAPIPFKIEQATPSVNWPSGLTAKVGQTLADVTLPSNNTGTTPGKFSWTNDSTDVGAVGGQTHNVTFTPYDTKNYTSIDGTTQVDVTAADLPKLVANPSKVTVYIVKDDNSQGTYELTNITLTPGVSGATYSLGSLTNDASIFSMVPAIDGTALKYTPAGSQTAGQTATQKINISATDYQDVTVTITFVVVETAKTTVTISGYTPDDGEYNGSQHDGYTGSFTPSASLGAGGTIKKHYTGTLWDGSVYNSETPPIYPGSYTLTATVEDDNYVGEAEINFTISKGTGITAAGKTVTFPAMLGNARPGSISDLKDLFSYSADAGDVTYESGAFNNIQGVLTGVPTISGSKLDYTAATGIASGRKSTLQITMRSDYYVDATATVTFNTTDKTMVTISGITVTDKDYDVNPIAPNLTGLSIMDGVTNKTSELSGKLIYTYSGTLSDGTVYSTPATPPTNAGSYTLTVTLEDEDYAADAVTIGFTINKINPTVFWPENLTATYGQTLATVSLGTNIGTDATVGVFSWTAGDTASVGQVNTTEGNPHNLTFAPTDKVNYNTVDNNVKIKVSQIAAGTLTATPNTVTLTFKEADTATYTYDLKAQITLSLEVADTGTVSYELGTFSDTMGILSGSPTLSNGVLTYTPSGNQVKNQTATQTIIIKTENYADITVTFTFEVDDKIDPPVGTVNWPTYFTADFGQTLGDLPLPERNTGSVAGAFTWTDGNGTPVGAIGEQSHNVTFTPVDIGTYNIVNQNATVMVSAANSLQPTNTNTLTIKVRQNLTTLATYKLFERVKALFPGGTDWSGLNCTPLMFANTENVLTGPPSITQDKMIYIPAAGKQVGWTATQTITVYTDNYAPVTVNIIFQVVDKTDVSITASGTPLTNVYNGSPFSPTISIDITDDEDDAVTLDASRIEYVYQGANGTSYGPSTTAPTDAGEYTVKVRVKNSDLDFRGESAAISFSITKADPTVNWPPGLTAGAGQTLGDVELPSNGTGTLGNFTWTDGDDKSVGSIGPNDHSVTFTPLDTRNYNPATNITSITVSKAASGLTVIPQTINICIPASANTVRTYNLSTHLRLVTTGAPTGSVSYALGTYNAGDSILSAQPTLNSGVLSYTPSGSDDADDTASQDIVISTANYNDVTVTVNFIIKGTTTVSIGGVTINGKVYDSKPIDAPDDLQLKITDVDGNDITVDDGTGNLVAVDFDNMIEYWYEGVKADGTLYPPTKDRPTDAGDYILVAKIEDNDYIGESDPVPFTIEQATPSITWPDNLEAEYGKTLNDVGLTGKGSSDVTGAFTWTDQNKSVGAAGTNDHSMIFTPTDKNYKTVKKLVPVKVIAVFDVGGTVTDEDGNNLNGAEVYIVKSGQRIYNTTTDNQGAFLIRSVLADTYNLVVVYTDDGKTTTVTSLLVLNRDITDIVVVVPINVKYRLNTIVEHKNTAPVNAVGALDAVYNAATVTDPTFGVTAEDLAIKISGGEITIKLIADNTANSDQLSEIKSNVGKNETVALTLDLSAVKIVNNGTTSTETSLKQLNSRVDIYIPLPPEVQGKAEYVVYRYHDGSVETILQGSENANSDGEYFTISDDGTMLVLHVKKFSAYAIAHANGAAPSADVTVIFNLAGGIRTGGGALTQTIAHGTAATAPTTTRDGYTFNGWDKSFTNVTTNITVTAQWTQNNTGGNGGNPIVTTPTDNDFHTDSDVSGLLNTADHVKYVSGVGNGRFNPYADMTRAEAAQMFYNLLINKNVTITKTFPDVADGVWYSKAVNTLAALGIITGYPDGGFHPNDKLTRAQLATIVVRFAKVSPGATRFSDVPASHWAYDYINTAANFGWVTGVGGGKFDPDRSITRAEAVTLINRMLRRYPDKAYIDRHNDLIWFSDVARSDWFYYEVIEAANEHDYEQDGKKEIWRDIKDKE